MMKRKVISSLYYWVLILLCLATLSTLLVSCNGGQKIDMYTHTPITLTSSKIIATLTPPETKIPSTGPLPTRFTPNASAFDPSGRLLFINTEAIIMADIRSESLLELTTTESIYDQPTETNDGFVYYLSDNDASQGVLELYRIKPNERKSERITNDNYFDFYLTSCHNQNIVAYVSDQHETNNTYGIYVSGLQGSLTPKKILERTESITSLKCSPNGKYLAFLMSKDFGIGDLYIINIDGTSLSQVTQSNNIYGLSWSPDSQQLAVAIKLKTGNKLAVLDPINKTISEFENMEPDLTIRTPLWAPNDSKILFETFDGKEETKLKIIDSDGRNEKVLLYSEKSDRFFSYGAVWSPDSDYIAYVLRNPEKTINMYILKVDSGIQKKLSIKAYLSISSLSWIFP